MHLAVVLLSLIAVIWSGDIKHWREYHATIWFYIGGNLLYNFLCANYWLWQFSTPNNHDHLVLELWYTFIVFPATLLMFLNRYPTRTVDQVFHYVFWCGLYILIEFLYQFTGHISYDNGWSWGMSAIFVFVMFPIFRIHHINPIVAYIISIPLIFLIVYYFQIPVSIPIENR